MPVKSALLVASASLRVTPWWPPATLDRRSRVVEGSTKTQWRRRRHCVSSKIKKLTFEFLNVLFWVVFYLGYWENGRRRLRRSACSRMEHVSALVELLRSSPRRLYQRFLFLFHNFSKLDNLEHIPSTQHKKRAPPWRKVPRTTIKKPQIKEISFLLLQPYVVSQKLMHYGLLMGCWRQLPKDWKTGRRWESRNSESSVSSSEKLELDAIQGQERRLRSKPLSFPNSAQARRWRRLFLKEMA